MLFMGEKDAHTIQIFGSTGSSHSDIELTDQSDTQWKSVSSGGVSKNLADMSTLKKLAGLITAVIQTAYAHGLGYTPTIVLVMPRGNVLAWESANADGTNIYLTGTGVSTVDAYVGR
jgi:hypothetical protein